MRQQHRGVGRKKSHVVDVPPMFMSAAELAQRWHVARSHVFTLANRGKLSFVRIGRRTLFPIDVIEEFERENRVGP